jgi:hypothetical protein
LARGHGKEKLVRKRKARRPERVISYRLDMRRSGKYRGAKRVGVAAKLAIAVSAATAGCFADNPVARYCQYGSVSQGQLDGCKSHVSEDRVNSYQTNAGRYGRGELSDCLADSGPFCKPD